VGGMSPGDEIRLTADDGYVVELMYENIYEPDSQQGTPILAWWTEKQGFAPEYTAAPALFFLADNHVFGNVDMRESLNPGYWRFYWCSGTEYPSAAGLAVRNVKTVEIYPATERDWDLTLDGHFVAKISRKEFEMGIACGARAHNHYSVYTDSKGHEWSGMPLYLLAGYVDDDCRHDENLVNNKAYNLSLAENNAYTVVVEGLTGDQAEFSSAEIIRNSGYLITNEMDGHKFDESGDYWPLALVGDNIPEEKRVYEVTKITLKPATGTEGVGSDNYTDGNSPVKESPFPVSGVIAGLLVSVLMSRRI
ncbi:MAG: hypothetical protein KAW93_10065, partial [Methanogenium sp.]|nr:hypothetical protein [Methanogenium sp.]